jgi:phosphatidylinositol 4-kinase B
VHIDFGFFFTNAPGKGIELEKKIPFKLHADYIEILGGLESELFQAFRRRFFK